MSQLDCHFKYKTAIVRGISSALPAEALRMGPKLNPIDLQKARSQWNHYVEILRDELGLRVIQLPADDKLPDCVFTEDALVAIGNKALITHPGHTSRRPETVEMRKLAQDLGFDLTIMAEKDKNAFMDGGDVLFTGQEIFVGLSRRTNEAGFKVLKETFSGIPVTSVPVEEGLHLKSGMSLAGPGILLYGVDNSGTKKIGEYIKQNAKFKYTMIPVEGDGTGANCLYIDSPKIGKTVVRQSYEHFPKAKAAFDKLSVPNVICCDHSETWKADGALTCSSVLLTI